MSDAPIVPLWQVIQGAVVTAIVAAAVEAYRRLNNLRGDFALVQKTLADQVQTNADTKAAFAKIDEALKRQVEQHYELKSAIARIPSREEMQDMFADFRDRAKPKRRPP